MIYLYIILSYYYRYAHRVRISNEASLADATRPVNKLLVYNMVIGSRVYARSRVKPSFANRSSVHQVLAYIFMSI